MEGLNHGNTRLIANILIANTDSCSVANVGYQVKSKSS